MNAKELYLAWLRTNHPNVYARALGKVFSPRSAGLGGLGDDLAMSVIQPVDVNSDVSLDPSVGAAIDAANSSPSSSWGDFFTSLTNAVSSVGQTVVNTQAQQNLLAINTQRARQGLPPVNANGVPVTAAQIAGTQSPLLQQMEAKLASAGNMPYLLVGGALVFALLMGGKRRG